MSKARLIILLAASLVLLLSACGKKGPLTRPQSSQTPVAIEWRAN